MRDNSEELTTLAIEIVRNVLDTLEIKPPKIEYFSNWDYNYDDCGNKYYTTDPYIAVSIEGEKRPFYFNIEDYGNVIELSTSILELFEDESPSYNKEL